METFKIKDLTGQAIEVTNIKQAIKQCRACAKSPFIMASGYTVGENHRFMLQQLLNLQPQTTKKHAK